MYEMQNTLSGPQGRLDTENLSDPVDTATETIRLTQKENKI